MNWSFITGAARKLPCTKIILFPIWIVIESGTTMADPKLPSACITLSSYGVAVGGSQAHFLCFFKCAVALVSCIMTFQNPITIPLDPIIAALISLKSLFVSQRRIIFSEGFRNVINKVACMPYKLPVFEFRFSMFDVLPWKANSSACASASSAIFMSSSKIQFLQWYLKFTMKLYHL